MWIHIGTALVTQAVLVLQIAGAVELQVTCPFVVPFNQASQVQPLPYQASGSLACQEPFLFACARSMAHSISQIINNHCKAQLKPCTSHNFFLALVCPIMHWHSTLLLHATAHASC